MLEAYSDTASHIASLTDLAAGRLNLGSLVNCSIRPHLFMPLGQISIDNRDIRCLENIVVQCNQSLANREQSDTKMIMFELCDTHRSIWVLHTVPQLLQHFDRFKRPAQTYESCGRATYAGVRSNRFLAT